MCKYVCPDGTVANIINIMADGTILDDVEGYVVPINENTMLFWNTLHTVIENIHRRQAEQKLSQYGLDEI